MKEEKIRQKGKAGALPDESMEAVSGGAAKSGDAAKAGAWVKRYCPNCGKPRTMNMDAYGNYVCLVCHKKFTGPKNAE